MKPNEIDEQLKRALRRCEAPQGFVARVLANVKGEASPAKPRSVWTLWCWPSLRWAAVAMLVVVAVSGIGYQIHERQQEAEARAAKRQVMLALRITRSKLKVAKEKVRAVETGRVENKL